MAFALVFIGLLLIVTGAKNTYQAFGAELVEDFTGPGNFTYWVAAIGVLGAIGYVKQFEKFSRLFLVLVIVAMVLSNRGIFAQITGTLASGPEHPSSATSTASTPVNNANVIPVVQTIVPSNAGSGAAQAHFQAVLNAAKLFIGLGA